MNRVRNFYGGSDNITRIVALVALIILGIITVPALANRAPLLAYGVTCDALSTASANGTHQSILKPEPGALRMELFTKESYIVGEQFVFDVRFTNESGGAMIFAFVPGEAVLRYSGREEGLSFWIQFSGNGQVLGEPANVKAPAPIRQQYTPETLRILGPHQRCTQPFQFDANRVRAAGIGQGQFRVAAVYRNSNRGNLSPVGQLTPTPVFTDQGVFTTLSDVRSNQVLLSIGATTP